MIRIYKSSSEYYVWTADEAYRLRKLHRLISPTVGCLPGCPLQNNLLSLPLLLSPYEARLAVVEGLAVLVDEDEVVRGVRRRHKVNRKRQLLYQQQIELGRADKLAEFESKIDMIVEGKRKKVMKRLEKSKENMALQEMTSKGNSESVLDDATRGSSSDVAELVTEEVERERCAIKASVLPESASSVQIHTARFPGDIIRESSLLTEWKFSRCEEMKYLVFRHFWKLHYCLSSALKFGGDFLVYPGDSGRFHSWFIVVCVDRNSPQPLGKLDVVRMGRMATSVKKTFVVAAVDMERGGSVECLSLRWRGKEE